MLYNMEKARFAGGVEGFVNNQAAIGGPAISDTSPDPGIRVDRRQHPATPSL